MEIIEKIKIADPLGLHLSFAAEIVKTSSAFKCRISMEHHHRQANGKSLLNLVALGAGYGSEIKITFEGKDAWKAQKSIHELLISGFSKTRERVMVP
jgi:phosphotransferase system HPr (HPr) family protein